MSGGASDDSSMSRLGALLLGCARMASQQAAAHKAELAAMRDVIATELVDREANAARVVERQQVLSDRANTGSAQHVPFERAQQASEAIEEMLLSLELNCTSKSAECGRLMKMDLDVAMH